MPSTSREIAESLDVSVVLEGSLRSAGKRIGATAQLVDGRSGFQLWSQAYDRRFTDLFELQDELANEIVCALSGYLQVALPATVETAMPTEDLQAYDLYLQARSLLIDRFGPETALAGRRLAQAALTRDPRFARAHSLLAVSCPWAFGAGFAQTASMLDDAERAAMQALEIDADLVESRAVLAQVDGYRGNWLQARRELDAALRLDQDNTVLFGTSSLLHFSVGQVRDAVYQARQADRLAPVVAPSRSPSAVP